MIDQNIAHELGGDGEEMHAVIPVNRIVVDEPQVSFVHQGGAFESVLIALSRNAPGQPAQLVVDQRHQLFACRAVAVVPSQQ